MADHYDCMNDVMSLGIHRLWKTYAIKLATIRSHEIVLDLAAGSGDLSLKIAKTIKAPGHLFVSDINSAMLNHARARLDDQGLVQAITYLQTDAEALPFCNNYFDCITISFGLRNITNKENGVARSLSFIKTRRPFFYP